MQEGTRAHSKVETTSNSTTKVKCDMWNFLRLSRRQFTHENFSMSITKQGFGFWHPVSDDDRNYIFRGLSG